MTVFDSTIWQKVTKRVQGDLYIFPTGDDFYDTAEEAARVAEQYRQKLFGEFAGKG